jgi:hypothetical protein
MSPCTITQFHVFHSFYDNGRSTEVLPFSSGSKIDIREPLIVVFILSRTRGECADPYIQ